MSESSDHTLEQPREPEILHLYTLHYPQGTWEAFIEAELPYLARAFKEVKIFPKRHTGEALRELPANVSVHFIAEHGQSSIMARLALMGMNIFKGSFLKQFSFQYSLAGQLLGKKQQLAAYIQRNPRALHYSFWFSEWATILGALSQDKVISGYVSRAHGYDLYDERAELGYHPYRHVQSIGLKKVFPISDLGAAYIRERLPHIAIERFYLGTLDCGKGPLPTAGITKILSVAIALPLKRLDRMVAAIAQCKEPVQWTYVGNGPDLDLLMEKAKDLPAHVSVRFLGHLEHDAVMELYQQESFHFLMSVSETEGLPVSMMEAISFGVPVLSSKVGGVHELVNSQTGMLFHVDTPIPELAAMIDGLLDSPMRSTAFREGVRGFWQTHFSADENYPSFIQKIKYMGA